MNFNRNESEALFISIRPLFAQAILAEEKTVELRRTRPKVVSGTTVILYSSSPQKAVVGIARVERITESSPSALWRQVRGVAGISKQEYLNYFEGAERAYAIHLSDVHEFVDPIKLDKLRGRWPGFHPPQSFRYIKLDDVKHWSAFSRSIST